MNNSIIMSGTSQPSSILIYTQLQPMSEESISLGPVHRQSSSWRKFVHPTIQQAQLESSITVVPLKNATTEGPLVLKPASPSEDIDVQEESFFRFLDELESGAYAANDTTIEK